MLVFAERGRLEVQHRMTTVEVASVTWVGGLMGVANLQ